MYLLDTDVVSEIRKAGNANPGVRAFFTNASRESFELYLSVITIGELRQGVERIRHRGDAAQAKRLERWLAQVTSTYADAIGEASRWSVAIPDHAKGFRSRTPVGA